MAVSFAEYKKAVAALAAALAMAETDITRDASIQRFEFCIELAWKLGGKLMGSGATAPKMIVREMARNELIENVGLWLDAIDRRNLSSRTYNAALVRRVYGFAVIFLPELQAFAEKIEEP